MNDHREFLYVYDTGDRPDGMTTAVAATWETGMAPLALFRERRDAHRFAYAEQARTGCMVHVLPSAEWEEEG